MKYCSNCGNQLEDDAKFCSVCGMQQGQTPTPEEKTEIEQLKNEFIKQLSHEKIYLFGSFATGPLWRMKYTKKEY